MVFHVLFFAARKMVLEKLDRIKQKGTRSNVGGKLGVVLCLASRTFSPDKNSKSRKNIVSVKISGVELYL